MAPSSGGWESAHARRPRRALFDARLHLAALARALAYCLLGRASEHAEVQARAIAGSEAHARQEAFLHLVQLIHQQLATSLGMLFMSSQTLAAGGTVSDEEAASNWTRLGNGDAFVFGRGMMAAHLRGDGPQHTWALFWSTPIRTRHSTTFRRIFDRMIDRARDCDVDGLLVETLLGSTHGQIRALMDTVRDLDPAGGQGE